MAKIWSTILAVFCFVIFLGSMDLSPVRAEPEMDSIETEEIEGTEEIFVDELAPRITLNLCGQEGKVLTCGEIFFYGETDKAGKPCIEFLLEIEEYEENDSCMSGIKYVTVEMNGELAFEKTYDGTENVVAVAEVVFGLENVSAADVYEGMIRVADNAGNESEMVLKVHKDMEGPCIRDVRMSEPISVQTETYFYNDTVLIEVACEDAGVGGTELEWGFIDAGNILPVGMVEVNEGNQASFELEPMTEDAFEELVYVRGRDAFDNVGEMLILQPIVIETQEQHDVAGIVEPHLLVDNITESPYKDATGKTLYAGKEGQVVLRINATDLTNGVKAIVWEVASEKGKQEALNGRISFCQGEFDEKDGTWELEDGTDYPKIVNGEVKIALEELNVNNVTVTIKMIDFSGNQTAEEVIFSVDRSAPVIVVEFDEALPDEEYTSIYSCKRTAKIAITDRNLDASQLSVNITNSEGTVPEVAEWGFSVDEENPAFTTCTTNVTFDMDGDYTMAIRCRDLAGHSAENMDIPEFTIDMTKPEMVVTYQNREVRNGRYYNAPQVIQIQITEHNFTSDRVAISGQSSPVLSEFRSEGNVHTAVILCNTDGEYQFDFTYTDKAGNAGEKYSSESFCIDMTIPVIEITEVENYSANNGTVAPKVAVSDVNLDDTSVEITITGANHGEVVLESVTYLQERGKVFSFSDIPRGQEWDDMYTLTVVVEDFAGNVNTKSIVFSVNRFGSVYVFSDSLKTIAGNYIQDEVAVKLTEINVDSLEPASIRVVVDQNGSVRDLEEGEDYQVTEVDGKGSWHQYEYNIDKGVFSGDGRYIVTVYSVDEAGNLNENRDETKQAEIRFGVDKTMPNIIPINVQSQTMYHADEIVAAVAVNDNLVLQDVQVFVGGESCEVTKIRDNYLFRITTADDYQKVTIVAQDAAGNRTNYVLTDILVTTNDWTHFVAKKKEEIKLLLDFLLQKAHKLLNL